MASTNNIVGSRRSRKEVNYAESDWHSSDSDYSRGRTKRKSTTFCSSRALETGMGHSRVDLIARGGLGSGGVKTRPFSQRGRSRGKKTNLSTTMEKETHMVDSHVDPIAENTNLCTQISSSTRKVVKETHMVDSHVDPIAENTNLCTQISSSTRKVVTEFADSGVDVIVGNSVRGCGRGRIGHGRGGQGGGQSGQRGTRWVKHGTQSRRSQQREAEGEINEETGNPEPSSIVGKGLSSSEEVMNMSRDSPSPVQVSLCKRTILSWLIDCERIEENEQVSYVYGPDQRVTLKGNITRGGIFCGCCQREISVETFEKHAGSDLGQPYKHIYLCGEDKMCFLQDYLIAAWLDKEEAKRRRPYVLKENAAGQNNDACSICGDEGDLICCDNCPSTYHPSCMDMERAPQRHWVCPYCICKFCGLGGESKEFVTCFQCDKKFHWGCFQQFEKEFSIETLHSSCSTLYCGPGCRQIYEKLDNSLRIRNDIFASYSWRVIRQTNTVSPGNPYLENNLKVALTRMLMDEAFVTIIDKQTGIDVVQSIVYSLRSKNLRRINFSRFYTFILEKDDAVIAAASIRFHGRGMAEMPFMATDKAYRSQGFCWLLMREIESFLRSLQVKTLVIPSTPETVEMWKQKFNFNVASRAMRREISSYNILMFPQATRLCKDLSARITDVIHDNADNNRNEVPNVEEPDMPAADRQLIDLNVEPLPEDC